MQLFEFGEGRQVRDGVELFEEVGDHLRSVVALTELVDVFEDAAEGVFSLGDGKVREVLALHLQALMMFQELLAEELRQALAGLTAKRPHDLQHIHDSLATLDCHSQLNITTLRQP